MTVVRKLVVDLGYVRAAESWKAFGLKPTDNSTLARAGFMVGKDGSLYGMATNRYSIVAHRLNAGAFTATGFSEGEYYTVPFSVLTSFVASTKTNKNTDVLIHIEWIDEDYTSVSISGAGAMSQEPCANASFPKVLGLLDKSAAHTGYPVAGLNIAQVALLSKVRTKRLVKASEHWTMTATDSQTPDKMGPFVFTNKDDVDVVVLCQPHHNIADYVNWNV
jgi:hypothetical protein